MSRGVTQRGAAKSSAKHNSGLCGLCTRCSPAPVAMSMWKSMRLRRYVVLMHIPSPCSWIMPPPLPNPQICSHGPVRRSVGGRSRGRVLCSTWSIYCACLDVCSQQWFIVGGLEGKERKNNALTEHKIVFKILPYLWTLGFIFYINIIKAGLFLKYIHGCESKACSLSPISSHSVNGGLWRPRTQCQIPHA